MRHRLPVCSAYAFSRAFLTLILVGTLSCSEDPAAPEDDDGGGPPPTGQVTKTITPAGDAISTQTSRGAVITLTFPPGAVGSPVDVTLKPASPETDSWVNVVVLPTNVVFLKDINVVVTAPADVTLDEFQQLFAGSRSVPVMLPTTVNLSARTLQTRLRGFGADATDQVGYVPRSAASQVDKVANNIAAGAFDCQRHVDVAQQALDDFIADGTYEAAIGAALSAASCAARANCSETDAWVTSTGQTACDELANALAAAGGVVDGFGELRQRVASVVYWASIAEATNPTCASLGAVEGTVAAKITEFRAFFDGELEDLIDQDYSTFAVLKNEARDANKLFTESLFFGADAVATALQNDGLFPTLVAMRENLYDLCGQDGWHYPLTNLTSVGFYAAEDVPGVPAPRNPVIGESVLYGPFTDQDIWDDLQFCATEATVSTTVVSGGTLATDSAGGSAPGSQTNEVTIRTPTRGKLILDGTIGAFTCWDDVEGDNTLAFDVGSRRVRTVARAGDEYLAAPVEFDIKQLAQQAGVVIEDSSEVTMTVKRLRANCDARLWGSSEYELLRINMEVEGPRLVITDNMPPTVDPGDTVTLEVLVEVQDQLGVSTVEAGIPIVVSTLGATATPAAGATNASGRFTTRVVIATVANASDILRTSSVDVFVGITAQVDGVTAHKVATSVVSGCVVDGSVVVNSQEELNAYNGVCRIDQLLQIVDDGSGSPITDLSPLSQLTYSGFGIQIANTALSTLAGLEKVSFGDGATLTITNNPNLTSLDALASQGGSDLLSLIVLTISNNPALTSMAAVRNLMHQSGVSVFFITVSENPLLTSLTGLDNVNTNGALLHVSNNAALASLGGLEALASADSVLIRANSSLTSLAALTGVTVTRSIVIDSNPVLVGLTGLEAVTAVARVCSITSNAELNNIDGLVNLASVGLSFTIANNPKLCTLPGWVSGVTSPSTSFVNNGTDPSCGGP